MRWSQYPVNTTKETPADAEVVNAILIYAEDMRITGFTAREFLRAPVFQMLYGRCRAGDDVGQSARARRS